MAFLNGWYKKFTAYKNHDLYISGESYAGIYIPYWSQQIVHQNENNTDHSLDIPLKGWMIGNGCTNWTYDCMPASMN